MQAIFIEAGHGKSTLGFKDMGAQCRFGDTIYYERNIAKELARRVLTILKGKPELKGTLIQGVGVETDANLKGKIKFVNSVIRENKFTPSKCFGIAIHMNAIGSGNATGFEVWHQKNLSSVPAAESLARAWGSYKITALRPKPIINTKDHWKYHRLYIDDYLCPYPLIETSFISNLGDVSSIINNYDRVAECLAHGILEYIRSK